MSLDGDYQTKDRTYDAMNIRVIVVIGLIAAAIIAVWYYASSLFEGPSML
jgi:hypothetical protein